MMETETLIVGAGLSGLSLAAQLSEINHDCLLVEARDRLGGRILSLDQDGAQFDMGPAWFWPGQPRIAALIQTLGLAQFDQYDRGDLMIEDEQGRVQRGRGYAAMQGSYRVQGGLGTLVEALAGRIDNGILRMNTAVTALEQTDEGVIAKTADGDMIAARTVALALPPRIAEHMLFTPKLSDDARQAMKEIPTWMAGQSKAMALYAQPFWRDDGLSGAAMSRYGPMVEIHDASPLEGGPYALFGFVGVPPQTRQNTAALRAAITSQLTRLFGPKASDMISLHVKDWAFDQFTATDADHQPVYSHPRYGLPNALREMWQGRLVFAGTEVAFDFGGYLEGALEAADRAVLQIKSITR